MTRPRCPTPSVLSSRSRTACSFALLQPARLAAVASFRHSPCFAPAVQAVLQQAYLWIFENGNVKAEASDQAS